MNFVIENIQNSNFFNILKILLSLFSRYPFQSIRFFIGNIFLGIFQIISIGSLYPIIFVVIGKEEKGNTYIDFFNNILHFSGFESSLQNYFILSIILAFLSVIFALIIDFDQGVFIKRLEAEMRINFASTVINAKWEILRDFKHGEFVNALNRESEQYKDLVKFSFLLLSSFIQMSLFSICLIIFNVNFALLSLVVLIFGFCILMPLFRISHTLGNYYSNEFAKFNGLLINSTRAFKNIKTASLEKFFIQYLIPNINRISNLYFKNIFISGLQSRISEFIGFFILCILLFISIKVIKIELANIILCQVLLLRIIGEIKTFTYNLNRSYSALPSIERIKHLQDTCTNKDENQSVKKALNKKVEEINFKDVSFKYDSSSVFLFTGLNVTFRKGDFWAISGSTGSGKTTILDLISGIVRPSSGDIVYNDIISKDMKIESLHEHTGYLTQNNFIFAGTILENILWGHEKPDMSKLDNVIKISQMKDIIAEKTLDFKVSESGQNLSGGQQQRIAIARTLLKDYDFILMDEPSSALDNETERNFLEALLSLKGEVGIIMVTHKKEYFKHADYILEMNGGGVEILPGKR